MNLKLIEPFVKGEKFSNGLEIDCSTTYPILDRLGLIVEKTRGKKVIHIGFADHVPLIKEKIAAGRWLHKRLVESCERCVGLDINREAVEFVQRELGIADVHCFDIFGDELFEDIRSERFDYLVLGDVIEHTNSPVEFLSAIDRKFGCIADKVLITVPNAFDFANIRLLTKNREVINTDHRYWFTPFTLAKVVSEAGLDAEEFGYCNPPYHKIGAVSRVLRRYHILSETIYCVARLNDSKL